MGAGPKKDKKFINKIYRQIKNGQKEIFVVKDKLGTAMQGYKVDSVANGPAANQTTTWSTVDFTIHGNMIVSGTIGATHITANSIDTEQLKISSATANSNRIHLDATNNQIKVYEGNGSSQTLRVKIGNLS